MNHTPGPWLIHPLDFAVYEDDSAGRVIARMVTPTLPPRDINTTEANARLIAAAPDMLNALESVRDHFWSDCRIPAEVRKDWESVYHTVIVPAIRKAKGEAL